MARILIIDDETLFRSMLRMTLEQLGHEVSEAEEGEEGLGLYDGSNFDVVMTDLLMPGKEGVETIMDLRKKNPAVKIIAMSGGGRVTSVDYLDIARKVGAKKLLAKPFSREDLRVVLDEILAAPGAPPAAG